MDKPVQRIRHDGTPLEATPKPSEKPWTVEVDVFLEDVTSDPVKFSLKSALQQKEGGDLIFHNRGRPGFTLVFHLHDPTGEFRFPGPPKLKKAVWSKVGTECSRNPDDEADEVLKPLRVINDGKTLVVANPNPKPGQGPFKYALRITRDDENYKVLDPGGDNQNGGWGVSR